MESVDRKPGPEHRRWFVQGARTLRALLRERGGEHLLPATGDWYLCPLCFEFVLSVDILADRSGMPSPRQHRPAAGAVGEGLAFTCARCRREPERGVGDGYPAPDVVRRVPFDELSAAIRAGAPTDRPDLRISGAIPLSMVGVPAGGRTDAIRTVRVPGPPGGRISPAVNILVGSRTRVDYDASATVAVRVGYLVAFAAFGWRYICQAALEPLRAHFRAGAATPAPIVSLTDLHAHPTSRQIWVVREPFDRRCVMVAYGRHQVYLPVLDDPRTLDDLARGLVGVDDRSRAATGRVLGDLYPWPGGPRHSMDPPPVG